MKKILYLLPIFFFALTLFGCDLSNSTSESSNYSISQEVATAISEIQTSNSNTSLNFYQDDLDSDCLKIINHIKSFKTEHLTNSEKQSIIEEINNVVNNYYQLQKSYKELDAIETDVYNELYPYYNYYSPLIDKLELEYQNLVAQFPNYTSITEADYNRAKNECAQTQANAYAKKALDEKYAKQKYSNQPGLLTNVLNSINREYQSTIKTAQAKFEPIENAWKKRQEIENKYSEYLNAYNTLYNQQTIVTQKYKTNYDQAKQTLKLNRQNIFGKIN